MAHFAREARVYVTLDAVTNEKPAPGVEWIAVKTSVALGEKARLEGAMVRVDGEGGARADMTGYIHAFNEIAFVDWCLLDEAGQPVPFDKALIPDLDASDPLVDKAMQEFVQRNPISARKRAASGTTS